MDNPLIVKPRTRVVDIYPGDVEATLAELNTRITVAAAEEREKPRRQGQKSAAVKLAEEYDRVVEAAKAEAVSLTLQAVPHRVLRQLQDDFPPRKGNKTDELYGFNEDEFFPALLRASLVDPVVSDEQFDDFVDTVHSAAWNRVCSDAYELATGEVALPKLSAVSVVRRLLLGVSPTRFDGQEPPERRDHYTPDGVHTGYTIVSREPEWDDYARGEALALLQLEQRTCTRCGLQDSFVQLDGVAEVSWPDGRRFKVTPYRCLGCGSLDGFNREMDELHSKHKPEPGQAAPGDGFRSIVEALD